MATYSTSQIRRAFEILQRSGRLDVAERALAGANFSVHIPDDAVAGLMAELVAALRDLEKKDASFFAQVMAGRDFGAMVRSGDCPC